MTLENWIILVPDIQQVNVQKLGAVTILLNG